jgi:hypothetical protein
MVLLDEIQVGGPGNTRNQSERRDSYVASRSASELLRADDERESFAT